MTREELRDYVEEQRSLNNIPYHVYSALIDGIDTLEQDPLSVEFINDYGVADVYMFGKDEKIQVVIDTMRKYQQIENIVDAYITDNPREPMYDTEDYMQSIREVLEDGNDK